MGGTVKVRAVKFTFQYGSTSIVSVGTGVSTLNRFTFQYGSTSIVF